MEKECETFFKLFPSKLKVNCSSIYKRLIESSNISTRLKKRIISFMLSKQEFYGFSYIKAIEITPELLSFKEIYNNLQIQEIAKLLDDLLEQSEAELTPADRYHKFLELVASILKEAFKDSPEENNKNFVLKIIAAINEDYITSITGKHNKKKLINLLRKNSEFDAMFNSKINKPNEIIPKILAGEPYQIHDRYTLATSKEFLANFDRILSIALNSNVSRDLITAIALALINKLQKENGLTLDTKMTNEDCENNDTYGYYSDEERIFYLNPSYIQDGSETLVEVINTIYHELEHAKQYQHKLPSAKNKTTGIDYETYLMIVDNFMQQSSFGQSYDDNYDIYSLEVAARREAAKKTSNIVLKHNPDFKEICEKLDIELPPEAKYIRFGIGRITKNTITKSFIDNVRSLFETDEFKKNAPEYATLKPRSIKVQQLFQDYPFLKNIFYVDVKKHIIELQPREKIEELLRRATNEADKELYRGILVDYEILASLKDPEIGITSDDVLPESAKKL